ncbi:uncharacterized protein G2W53_002259 [Senna tora]|uniref:Uncharacterized protein n=1 Tax=Senna tora TaxID=362788 RepID=A0A835CK68_9FABA|nr:uncharacterized protein G2W53_002259 [Senna tora]
MRDLWVGPAFVITYAAFCHVPRGDAYHLPPRGTHAGLQEGTLGPTSPRSRHSPLQELHLPIN